MSADVEAVAEWAAARGFASAAGESVMEVLNSITAQVDKAQAAATAFNALALQFASLKRVCEAGWARGEPCRFCQGVRKHADTCYVKSGTGFDLLCEHEATVRENDELRVALAARLPVNGKHILAGQKHMTLRQRARLRFQKGAS